MIKNIIHSILLFAVLLFFGTLRAQEVDDMKTISTEACGCIDKISDDQDRQVIVEKANECIKTVMMAFQLKKQISIIDSEIKAAEKSGDTTAKTIYINPNPDVANVQKYMFENCASMKSLLSSNNKKSKHSMSEDKKALKFYEEGDGYYKRGEYDMALINYNKAVKADKKFAFAWDNMGMCYRKLGNYKKAIECYQESLKVDPSGTMPLQNMAVAYAYLEDHKSAAETYEKFIALYPGDPEGHYGAGRAFYFAGEYAKGLDHMFKAYSLYSESQSPYVDDAVKNLQAFYADLKEKGKESLFEEAAKNNNIPID